MTLLAVSNLDIALAGTEPPVRIIRALDFTLEAGETLGIVGESGSGKSMTALALMGLAPSVMRLSGSIRFEGNELLPLDEATMTRLRGSRIGMIFQEPMTALNPVRRIGAQIGETLDLHLELTAAERSARIAHLLERVGLPAPRFSPDLYPHQLSGGMLQRTLIALSAALQPDLLIADEPTTNLDNIVERQIIGLFRRLKDKLGSAIIFITHDISLAAGLCDRIAVMYAGEIVETGPAETIFNSPAHPYTVGLIETARQLDAKVERLREIPGELPSGSVDAAGCLFAPRCTLATEACRAAPPPEIVLAPGHAVRCIRHG